MVWVKRVSIEIDAAAHNAAGPSRVPELSRDEPVTLRTFAGMAENSMIFWTIEAIDGNERTGFVIQDGQALPQNRDRYQATGSDVETT